MTTLFDTPTGIEEDLGITGAEAALLGAMIIEDEEHALFEDAATSHHADNDQAMAAYTHARNGLEHSWSQLAQHHKAAEAQLTLEDEQQFD